METQVWIPVLPPVACVTWHRLTYCESAASHPNPGGQRGIGCLTHFLDEKPEAQASSDMLIVTRFEAGERRLERRPAGFVPGCAPPRSSVKRRPKRKGSLQPLSLERLVSSEGKLLASQPRPGWPLPHEQRHLDLESIFPPPRTCLA